MADGIFGLAPAGRLEATRGESFRFLFPQGKVVAKAVYRDGGRKPGISCLGSKQVARSILEVVAVVIFVMSASDQSAEEDKDKH